MEGLYHVASCWPAGWTNFDKDYIGDSGAMRTKVPWGIWVNGGFFHAGCQIELSVADVIQMATDAWSYRPLCSFF